MCGSAGRVLFGTVREVDVKGRGKDWAAEDIVCRIWIMYIKK